MFSLSRSSWRSYLDAFIAHKDSVLQQKKPFQYTVPVAGHVNQKKVYVTDMDRDVTFAGTVKSLVNKNGTMTVSLVNVQVYEYSTSNPLFELPKISFSRPADKLFVEEI